MESSYSDYLPTESSVIKGKPSGSQPDVSIRITGEAWGKFFCLLLHPQQFKLLDVGQNSGLSIFHSSAGYSSSQC